MTTLLPYQVPVYRIALEPLVTDEVMGQLEHLPPKLVKYINPAQVIAYALNRLPSLYATSVEGWTQQQRRAKNELEKQIFIAVPQGLAAVQRDPLKVSTPLMCLEDSELMAFTDASIFQSYPFAENL